MRFAASNGALWQVITECISASEIRTMKCAILNKLLYQLIKCGFQGMKMTASSRTTVTRKFHSSTPKVPYKTWTSKIIKKRLKKIKLKSKNCNIPLKHKCENISDSKISNSLPSKKLSDDLIGNHMTCDESNCAIKSDTDLVNNNSNEESDYTKELVQHECKKIPIVYVTDVLTTQGTTTKENFMDYFALRKKDSVTKNLLTKSSSSGMVKLSQSVNVPVSSDLGRMMVAREGTVLPDSYKIRKIERSERNVNRPFIQSDKVIEYPITYIERNEKTSCSSQEKKYPFIGLKNLSVILHRTDLVKLQKKLKSVRSKRKQRVKRLQGKLKNLTVIVKNSERQKVDKLLSRKLVR